MAGPICQRWSWHPRGLSNGRHWPQVRLAHRGLSRRAWAVTTQALARPGRWTCRPVPLEASSLGFFWPILTAFSPNLNQFWQKARESRPALGGNSGHTSACGLEHFLTKCLLWPSQNTGQTHVTPKSAAVQASFPRVE